MVWYLISYKRISVSCLTINGSNKLKPCGNFRKYALQVYANWNLTETRKAFLHCWNCAETYYIRFQVTETFWKLFSMFPYCWNLTETNYIRFQLTETLRKLFSSFITHQVSADRNLTESSWNYTIVSALLKLYRKLQLQVSI